MTEQAKSAYGTWEENREITNPETGETSSQITNVYYQGALVAWEDNEVWYGGKIGGTELSDSDGISSGINLPMSEKANLYYAGTAPAPITLRFTLTP